jgi:hypothetical protein
MKKGSGRSSIAGYYDRESAAEVAGSLGGFGAMMATTLRTGHRGD